MNASSALISVGDVESIVNRRCVDCLMRDVHQRITTTEVLNLLRDILFECEMASTPVAELRHEEPEPPKPEPPKAEAPKAEESKAEPPKIEKPQISPDYTKYQSKSERTVANAIKQLGYTPYHNVIKRDCIGKFRPLPFDFGILVNGRELLIEFDGEQHEMPIKHFGGAEKLSEIASYDAIKTEYCKRNGIPLLRLNKRSSVLKEVKTFIDAYESH